MTRQSIIDVGHGPELAGGKLARRDIHVSRKSCHMGSLLHCFTELVFRCLLAIPRYYFVCLGESSIAVTHW